MLHVGQWAEGQPNGPGVVASSKGERFEGYFLDGVIWGPCHYCYAPPQAAAAEQEGRRPGSGGASTPLHRMRYRGMVNGKPQGRGCMDWSSGRAQAG